MRCIGTLNKARLANIFQPFIKSVRIKKATVRIQHEILSVQFAFGCLFRKITQGFADATASRCTGYIELVQAYKAGGIRWRQRDSATNVIIAFSDPEPTTNFFK